MKWFVLFVGIIVLCLVVALLLGLAGGGLGRASSSLSHEPLPDDSLADTDFDDLVFDVGARGYRMSQVDGVVDRLRRELREKDEEIAVLRGEATPTATELATQTATETASQPATETASQPATEPATEPTSQPATDPADDGGSPPVEESGERMPSAPTVGHERTP